MDSDPTSGTPGPDDDDEPIEALSELDLEPSGSFWARVRKKIDRRVSAGHVASFAWDLPRLVFIEFLEIVFSLFPATKDRKGGHR
jgi:hypothetical protein